MNASVQLPRFATFYAGGRDRYGLVAADGIIDLTEGGLSPYPDLKAVIEAGALEELAAQASDRPVSWREDEVEFLPPLAAPGKILCVGVNYPDRAQEYRDDQPPPAYPSIFVRFPQSFTGHRQNLVRPRESQQLDYEGEIAVIIGKAGRRIALDAAYDHIAALTLCNEGTIRDWVRHGKFNVTPGKNWDRSGSMGPWLVPFRDKGQLDDITLTTKVNGETRQSDRTSRMIFGFRELVHYISTFTTLLPGDVIVCGTPTGAGARSEPPVWLRPGDLVEVAAEGIGCLVNGVVDDEPDP